MASTLNASNSGAGGLISTADASGVLQLQTAGTTAVTIDTSQNVGIGTTTPSTLGKLAVIGGAVVANGGGTVDPEFRLSGASAGVTRNYAMGTDSGQRLYWYDYTAAAYRMLIDSSGNVLVGTTTLYGKVTSEAAGANATEAPFSANVTSASGVGSCNVLRSLRGGTQVGSITNTSTATAYNTSSDYRLKENIVPMTGALNTVAQLKPVTYKWKVDGSDGQGFIAHELQEVVPDCVTGEKDAVDEEGKPIYQGIDTSFLVATLTAAIQEMKAIIDEQSARITALENK